MADVIRILYIDDEPDLLAIGKSYLEQFKEFFVDPIDNPLTALKKLQKETYHAIVSDNEMPGMSGIELLIQIRKSGNNIPFIILTEKGREEVALEALNKGADFYLLKGDNLQTQFAELEHQIRHAVLLRNAEAQILDHERREFDIINFLPDATFAIDTNGVVIAWNRAMEQITGVLSTDMLGKGNYEYAIPIYHTRRPLLIDYVLFEDPDILSYYPKVQREGKTLSAEGSSPVLFNGKGAYIWFTATPLYDSHGSVIGAIESIRDITQRYQVEEQLRESKADLLAIIENTDDIIALYDLEIRLLVFNKACRDIYHDLFGIEIYKGLYTLDLFPESQKSFWIANNSRALAGESFSSEFSIPSPNGQVKFFELFFNPIRNENGIIGFSTLSRDITNRKQAENENIRKNEELQGAYEQIMAVEEELRANLDTLIIQEQLVRESEEQFQSLFMNMIDGAVLHDLTYDSEGRPSDYILKKVNPAFESQLGISRDAVIGKTSREAYGAVDPPYFDIYVRVVETGNPESFETYFPPLDKHFSISVYCPYKGSFVTIFEDISERKQAVEALKHQNNVLISTQEELFQAKQYLENLISVANVPIIVWDPSFRITRLNHAFELLVGRTAEELIGYSLDSLFPPGYVDHHRFRSLITSQSRNEERFHYTKKILN